MKPGSATSTFNQHAQPSGIPEHGATRGGAGATGPDAAAFAVHARLCELVPDATERAALVQVPAAVDAAWLDGKMVPVLRAKRTAMEAAIARLEYDASR